MHLRQAVRLQLGDAKGAEHFRRQAELLAVQARTRQMFTTSLINELVAYTMASDLVGVRQTADRIAEHAKVTPGWLPLSRLAEANFELLRGNPQQALDAVREARALSDPEAPGPLRSPTPWFLSCSTYIQALMRLERVTEARDEARRILELFDRIGVRIQESVVAQLAIAETMLGDYPTGVALLEGVIARQRELGVVGLQLGASYEARARIAILAEDGPAVEKYGRLTAEAYRHGQGSPLGARYERLMADAQRAGVDVLPSLSEFDNTVFGNTMLRTRTSGTTVVAAAMRGASGEERMQRGLRLLIEAWGASGGHLYRVDQDELAPGASQDVAASDQHLEFARSCLERAFVYEEETETRLLADEPSESTAADVLTFHDDGTLYEGVVISALQRGELRPVAVALLADPKSERIRSGLPNRHTILGALGRHLIGTTDTTDVTA